ncbi:MAG: hypothetical protein GPJ54_18090 [Candidatus Heimdallarchaeota archaeon]|nr:hypothetical protein [Candidatus Heimdallarchaeota archaeon]
MSNPSREQLSGTESEYIEDEILAKSNRIIASRRRAIMLASAIIFLLIVPLIALLQYGLSSNFILLYGFILVTWGAFAYTMYFYAGPQFSNIKYTNMGGYSPQANLMVLGEIYRDKVVNSDEVQGDHLMDKPSNSVYLFGLIILIGFIFIAFGFLFD